jgi:hypothetical protein
MKTHWLIRSILVASIVGIGNATLTGCDKIQYSEYRTLVRNQLRDPDSAQFKDEKISKGYYCANINFKTTSGGYVGYTPFMAIHDTGSGEKKYLINAMGGGNIDYYTEMLDVQIEITKEQNDRGAILGTPSERQNANQMLAYDKLFQRWWKKYCE